jgi:hypothetical protein
MATTKKKKQSVKKAPHYRSFVRADGPKPFMAFRFTHQTTYWVIIGLLVLALGTWAMYLTVRVQNLYDKVDASRTVENTYIPVHKR